MPVLNTWIEIISYCYFTWEFMKIAKLNHQNLLYLSFPVWNIGLSGPKMNAEEHKLIPYVLCIVYFLLLDRFQKEKLQINIQNKSLNTLIYG